MDIQLKFINQSNDANNSDVIIFQNNVATNLDELAVAWLVIQNCGQGDNHPFVLPMSMTVCASDSYGNYTRQLPAEYGQLFAVNLTSAGDLLSYAGASSARDRVEVVNRLNTGAIDVMIFKAGKVFAQKTSLAPGATASFKFKPTIWIGVASQIQQGQVVNSAILSGINTEISLVGIARADIVMTGGGPGPNSRPFEFNLENVVMA